MSRPRSFKNINDLLRNAKAWGLLVRHGGKHWIIELDRRGFGPNQFLVSLPTTGPVHTSLIQNKVSEIKRLTKSLTGISMDIRRDPPRREAPPTVQEPLVVKSVAEAPQPVVPEASGSPQEVPPAISTPSPISVSPVAYEDLKRAVREVMVELIRGAVDAILPKVAPATVAAAPVVEAAVETAPLTKLVLTTPAPAHCACGGNSVFDVHSEKHCYSKAVAPVKVKQRRKHLPKDQKLDLIRLYETGESMRECARAFGVSESCAYGILRGAKIKTHRENKI